jgi:hypothetical protein
MSSDFVRYSPDIETIDRNLDQLMEQIVGFWEKAVRESPTREGAGHALRGAHAKAIGVAKAEVEILSDVPAAYAQGIYTRPGRHGALIRFSMANNHLGPDAQLGSVLGFAIKIFDVDGSKLVEDEPDSNTFDLVLKNNPTFIANTAKHYLFIQEIGNDAGKYLARGKAGFRELLTDLLTGKGTFNQWRVSAEHRPLGEIMQVRRIYAASAKVRRTLNHQPQIEPTSADEVLPSPMLEREPVGAHA